MPSAPPQSGATQRTLRTDLRGVVHRKGRFKCHCRIQGGGREGTIMMAGQVSSTGNNARGVTGYAIGSSGRTYGVHGRPDRNTDNASGVKGEASAGATVGV